MRLIVSANVVLTDDARCLRLVGCNCPAKELNVTMGPSSVLERLQGTATTTPRGTLGHAHDAIPPEHTGPTFCELLLIASITIE